jgi:O-antigen ligase
LGIFLVPGAFFLLLRSYESSAKVTKLAMIVAVICLSVVFIGSSGTGIIVAASAVLFLIISQKLKVRKFVFMGIILAVYAVFIFFPDDFFITEYWLKFTDYLGKDVSLTSRTLIWKEAEALVLDNWLFGAGRGVEITYMGSLGEWQMTHEAHNFVLEILMEGGVVALALFGALFFKAIKGLNMSNKTHKLVFIALCVIMINGLTESTVNNFFVVAMLGVACRFANEKVDSENEKWIADSKS